MTPNPQPFLSGKIQLNIIGFILCVILGFSLWKMLHPFTWLSIIPLLFVAYGLFRVIFELTWNRNNVPTLATSHAGRAKMTELLKIAAAPRAGYSIIDLGSGRGELTRHIAKAIPTARVIGIEMARIPFLQSRFVQRWLGPSNLSYECLDFWPYDCSQIDAVVFYLSGTFARKVGEKLHRELKPGSLVISHTFALEGAWGEPAEILHFRTPFKEVIYVYRKS